MAEHTTTHSAVLRWVFWPAAAIAAIFVAFTLSAPDLANTVFGAIEEFIVDTFNWYYVLIATGFVGFSVWLGFSKYGDIKLGKDDDEPEFSLMSWFALLFAAGMGIGLVFYGVSEPLSHFIDPRPGVTGTPQYLAEYALRQTYLHWGLHAWAIYVVVGLALAYALHRRGRPISIRWTLEPLLGKRVTGSWGHLIDVIALVGTLFGVATSLGLGVLQISSGLSSAGLFTPSVLGQVIIIVVITACVLLSVLSGVGKGMKWLSNTNLVLAGLFLLFMLFAGPTTFLLRELVESFGLYLQNFLSLSFNVNAFSGRAGTEWQASWSSFYLSWWIAWAPFVGVFIARVSKGRTVRQFVAGVLLVPTLLGILWFSILGGSALYIELSGDKSLREPNGSVSLENSLFALLHHVPATSVATVGVVLLITIFFVTSADSGALVMGMIATGGDVEPRNWVRVFFTLITATLAIALLIAGGLDALQTAAIIFALPFSVVMLLICWSTVIAFQRERRAYDKAQRAQFVDRIGEYYGLEVEQPTERGIQWHAPTWFSLLTKARRTQPPTQPRHAESENDVVESENDVESTTDAAETSSSEPPIRPDEPLK